jgi:hypothetical protein
VSYFLLLFTEKTAHPFCLRRSGSQVVKKKREFASIKRTGKPPAKGVYLWSILNDLH